MSKIKTQRGSSKKAQLQRILNLEVAVTQLSELIGAQNACLKQCVLIGDVLLDKGLVVDEEIRAKAESILEQAKGNMITEGSLSSSEDEIPSLEDEIPSFEDEIPSFDIQFPEADADADADAAAECFLDSSREV